MTHLHKFCNTEPGFVNKQQPRRCGGGVAAAQAAGFTLLELSIALAVVMVVLGAVLIGVSGNNSDYRALQNAALIVQADMRYAQRRSVLEGRRIWVQFVPQTNRYEIYTWLPNTTIRTVNLPNGVTIQGTSFVTNRGSNLMYYLPRGTMGPSSGTIVLASGRYKIELTTTVSGGRVAIGPVVPVVIGGN